MAIQEQSSVFRQVHTLFGIGTVREQTDGQLLRSFASGRGEAAELAFSALVARHGAMVFRTCRGILRDQHHAEDAFQATFLVLMRKSASLSMDRSLGPWLQQVAYRAACCARSAIITRQVHERRAAERMAGRDANDENPDGWEAVLHEEIARLPECYRGPLVVCDLEGCTQEQAARVLGCPVGTVKSRLARGREQLRVRLIRRGYPAAVGVGAAGLSAGTVPAALGETTIRTALRIALGGPAPRGTGTAVDTLVERVLRSMTHRALKTVFVSVLALGTAAGVLAHVAAARKTEPPESNQPPAPQAVVQAGPNRGDRQGLREGLAVSGVVRMPDGSPASGAIIESAMQDQPTLVVRADTAGRFRLEGVFGNGSRLFAHTPDGTLQVARMTPADAARVDLAAPVELKLAPAAAHELTVRAEGKPVEGAEVVMAGQYFNVSGLSDREGRVLLHCPTGETITHVVAWHPALGVGGVRQNEDGRRRTTSRVVLLPPKPLKVRVVDLQGRGVPALEIGVHFRTEDSDWIVSGQIDRTHLRTDAEGVATIRWAPREKLRYADVVLVGSDWKIDETDVGRIDERLVTVHVRREHAVEGHVIMPPGASAEGLLISGFGFGPGRQGDIPYARARRDGSFTLRVPSGHAFVVGIADREWAGDLWSGTILENDAAKAATIAIKAYPATPVTVRVTRGPRREPVTDAWIDVASRADVAWVDDKGKKHSAQGRVGRWWKTDASGVARGGVGKGEQRVTLASEAWREERTLQVSSNEPIELEFHRDWQGERRIAGRLMADGAPFQPSTALIAYAWATREPLVPLEFTPKVGADGTYEVSFDAETLSLYFGDPEKHRAALVRVGKDGSAPSVEMAPTASYSGALLDENKQPMADRTLQLYLKTSMHEAVPAQRTDSAGRFRFPVVPANVPLRLEFKNEPKGPQYYLFADRLFDPGEVREHDRVETHRADSPGASVRPSIPLDERVKAVAQDARLTGMHALVLLQGDSAPDTLGAVEHVLDGSKGKDILRYLPVRVEPPQIEREAAFLDGRHWPIPGPGEVVLVALDGDASTLGTEHIVAGKEAEASRLGAQFLKRHSPPVRDALARLKTAQTEASRTGRRVWIIQGGPRCGPCFRLARWIDAHHATLEKDFVVLEMMSFLEDHGAAVLAQLPIRDQSTPWHAFTEPDGTVLATSEGVLGNIGFPSSVEDLRHFRSMLDRAARHMTADELATLIKSLAPDR